MIFASFPLQTMILATVFGYEQFTAVKALGVILTGVGVGFALGEKAVQSNIASTGWIGELAVFASALSGAICSVLYRPYLRKYPTLPVSVLAMFASVVFLAALAAGEGFFHSLPRFTPGGIGYYLWLWALNHTTPTRVTVFFALSPVTATVLGRVFLAESVSASFLGGLLCMGLGLWLSHWQSYRNSAISHPS